jgi:hypothetical protein
MPIRGAVLSHEPGTPVHPLFVGDCAGVLRGVRSTQLSLLPSASPRLLLSYTLRGPGGTERGLRARTATRERSRGVAMEPITR